MLFNLQTLFFVGLSFPFLNLLMLFRWLCLVERGLFLNKLAQMTHLRRSTAKKKFLCMCLTCLGFVFKLFERSKTLLTSLFSAQLLSAQVLSPYLILLVQ